MDIREQEYQRVYAQIDLDAIVQNLYHMQKTLKQDTQIIAVIKADGYGHGSVPIARHIEGLSAVSAFAVATAEEAHILRKAGIQKPVLILGYTFPYCYKMLAEEEIRPTVFREDSLADLEQAAVCTGKNIKVHIKVDTGMSRVGIRPDDSGIQFIQRLMDSPYIEIEGIFTHFAKADETDKGPARKQLTLFQTFTRRIERELRLVIPIQHASNSAGILELPEANMDAVRAGISLYGIYPSEETTGNVPLKPALSLHSHIIYKKQLHKGQSVSYGGIFTADREMTIATIPVGYGDGYPRSLSNKGEVLVHGKRAQILGRICMDQFMIDITHIPQAGEGDLVTLIGADGEEQITAQEVGNISGRFPYELMCDLGKRIPRVYMCGGIISGTKDYRNDYM